MAMPRKNSDNGGVEIKDMSEADLLLLSTVDQGENIIGETE